MSFKIQKILRFIPIVNFACLFCMTCVQSKYSITLRRKINDVVRLILPIIIINAMRLLIMYIFKNEVLDKIIMPFALYFMLFTLSSTAIVIQERLIAENTKIDNKENGVECNKHKEEN